jgi:hypothetical protein
MIQKFRIFITIPFYCLSKNNHVYTLKHDLKKLQQSMNPNDKVKISLASSNYYVKENRNYNNLYDDVKY